MSPLFAYHRDLSFFLQIGSFGERLKSFHSLQIAIICTVFLGLSTWKKGRRELHHQNSMSENCSTVSSGVSTKSSTEKKRKKRRWDQPAEILVSAGVVPGILPFPNMGFPSGITPCCVTTAAGASFTNPLASTGSTLTSMLPVPLQQHAVAIMPKIIQTKIQDDVIAREVIINDADSSTRYKLTKRQTQDEILKCTGATVITRGKYRPPNAPPDGEKPLYLHISAPAHLGTTVERIKAVDAAAAMVEEMLRQGPMNDLPKVNHNQPFSTCVFLSFEAEPSSNIANRIRGPNDQYVNHIMNETGATVLLRGQGSGNSESFGNDGGQQPLHLFLTSNNLQSLECAKLLAENLMDTISAEFDAPRVSSSKVYGAVPPPPQLSAGVQRSEGETQPNNLAVGISTPLSGLPSAASLGVISPAGCSAGQSQINMASVTGTSLSGRTSYNGYEGIYPQATPLQQVAQVLKQTTSPITAAVAPSASVCSASVSNGTSLGNEKRSSQKRKFQELPSAIKGDDITNQGLEFSKPCGLISDLGKKDVTANVVSYKSIKPPPPTTKGAEAAEEESLTEVMLPPPPPPPNTMLTPPAPKYVSPAPSVPAGKNTLPVSASDNIPDTLIKLMEYGDESEDDDETDKNIDETFKRSSVAPAGPKPFWAV